MSLGYCDLHNHTLPGVDDGARTMDEALNMASSAVADGISTVLLTPHNQQVQRFLEDGTFPQRVEALRRQLAEAGLALSIFVGMENYLEPDLPRKVDKQLALPINGTKYILVEFPYAEILPLYADETLFQLQLRGFIPIIAHPDRCEAFAHNPDLLETLVKRGMLAQLTAGALAGKFGKRYQNAAETMLRRRLVHVIATDAHRSRGLRLPIISEGLRRAARIVGEQQANAMATTIPSAIVQGRPIPQTPDT